MKAITARPLAAIGKQRCSRRMLGLSFVLATLAVVFILPGSAFAGTEPATTIPVLVYNYAQVPPATLARAEREADKILGVASVRVVWLDCLGKARANDAKELCQKGWGSETPGMRLISGTNKFQDSEFGYAAIPVLVTVYYEKIARRARSDDAPFELPLLLGCVMAHELGHLLLGTPAHSRTGIMQPKWGGDQIRQALTAGLQFTPQQSRLIREQVRMNVQQASLISVPANAVP